MNPGDIVRVSDETLYPLCVRCADSVGPPPFNPLGVVILADWRGVLVAHDTPEGSLILGWSFIEVRLERRASWLWRLIGWPYYAFLRWKARR